MTAAFPHVFEPLRLRHKKLRSRITFGAHTANMAEGGPSSCRYPRIRSFVGSNIGVAPTMATVTG